MIHTLDADLVRKQSNYRTRRARLRDKRGLGLLYVASQATRVTWYLAQHLLAQRLSQKKSDISIPKQPRGFPRIRYLLDDLAKVFEAEWKDISSEIYKAPYDLLANPLKAVADSRRFLLDLPKVNKRRRNGLNDKLSEGLRAETAYPSYYEQNFLNQTDGYLTAGSAQLYDHQVETLFLGSGDLMRRRALPAIAEIVSAKHGEELSLLDVASGTGRLLSYVNDNWPKLSTIALDLSRPYLMHSRETALLNHQPCVQSLAEQLPIKTESQDIILCVFLFHELPHSIRKEVAHEFARVLRPGGRLVFVDSIQRGDDLSYDYLIERFPHLLHEPYYSDYINCDLAKMFSNCSLVKTSEYRAFLSKILTFDKPSQERG